MKKIGVDIDEVLCEGVQNFLDHFNKVHNTDFKKEDISDYGFEWAIKHGYSKDYMFKHLLEHLYENLENYELVKGSREALEKIKNKYELYIVTARNEEYKNKTINWLKKSFRDNFFKDYFFITGKNKKYSCKAQACIEEGIDYLIEDDPRYALKAADEGIKVLLMSCPWNRDIKENKNITQVKSWKEIMDFEF